MSSDRIHTDRSDSQVWRIRLSAGASGEVTLDGPLVDALLAVVKSSDATGCRVLVLESAVPGVFCRGMDLRSASEAERDAVAQELRTYALCLEALREGRAAVLALVDGEAKGGGVGLAAAADYVVATRDSSFAFPEIFLGLMPAMVLPVLRERVGHQRARWFAMSGASLSATESHAVGLVDALAEDAGQAEKFVRAAIKVLLRAAPEAVARTKAFSVETADLGLRESLARGAQRTAHDVSDPETAAAIQTFLDGASPPWFSKYRPGEEGS